LHSIWYQAGSRSPSTTPVQARVKKSPGVRPNINLIALEIEPLIYYSYKSKYKRVW